MRLHELLCKLDNIRLRLVSIFWYRWRFGKCGRRLTIGGYPRLINPHLIFLGDRVNIGPFSRLEVHPGDTNAAELRIGNDAFIQHAVHIYVAGHLAIGDNALFASGVMITDNNHGISPAAGPLPTAVR